MIVNRQRRVPITLKPLREFCTRVQQQLRFPAESVTVQLISDDAMARLNHTYRGKQGPTDVLSFPAADGKFNAEQEYIGDIAISPETARRNARRFSRSLSVEMRILILHGMIHLAGYDHVTDNGEMEKFEQKLRRRLGISARGSAKPKVAKR